jgi:hypothetical protein
MFATMRSAKPTPMATRTRIIFALGFLGVGLSSDEGLSFSVTTYLR